MFFINDRSMNMKKSRIRRILMVGLGMMFFTLSCTDLEEELYSDVTADNFFKTPMNLLPPWTGLLFTWRIGNHTGFVGIE